MPTKYCGAEYIIEAPNSPDLVSDGLNSTMTRTYQIKAATAAVALTLVKALAPATATVDLIPLNAPRRIGLRARSVNFWEGIVDYRHPARDEQSQDELVEAGDERVSGSFSGQSIHITEATSQTKYGTNSRDVSNRINVNIDGSVDGMDVNETTGSFTVETVINSATATNAWFKERKKQVWTFNNGSFRSWNAGEVALVGMDYRQRSNGDWEISYTFQIFEEEVVSSIAGISLGGSVTIKGKDFVWVMYARKEDATAKAVVPEPVGAYVANVYKETNFANLGIAT